MRVDVPFGYAIVPRFDKGNEGNDCGKCVFAPPDGKCFVLTCSSCYYEMIKLPDGFWEMMEAKK